MNALPENVAVAFRFAQGLWPHDVAAGSEATAVAWSDALAGFTVDELCPALEAMARSSNKMPTLAALLAELNDRRRHAEREARPLLEPPPAAEPTAGQKFLRESQKRRDQYTDELVKARTKLATHGGIPPDADEVAEFRAWAAEIGPIEAQWLHDHGGVVPEAASKVLEIHGNLAEAMYGPGMPAEPDAVPSPKSTEELAQEFAVRWRGARTAGEREALKQEGQSFTPELRAAVKAVLGVPA